MAIADRPGVRDVAYNGSGGPLGGPTQSPPEGGPTQGPSEGRRWKRKASIAALAAGGLLVGTGIGAAAGGVKTKTVEQTRTVVSVRTHKVPVVHFRTRVVTHTNTVTKTVTAAAPPSTTSAPAVGGPADGHVFHGNGGQSIGTINVSAPSTLRWSCPSCAGDNFAVTNSPSDSGSIFVNALGPTSGSTSVDPGVYHDVSVDTEGGDWTIVISPG